MKGLAGQGVNRMPGRLRTRVINGRRRTVYRRADGKYKLGEHRYAVRTPRRDGKIHARHKVKDPHYAHAGDKNTRRKTRSGSGGKLGWF